MPESAETEKKRRKDPSGTVLLGICLILSICIYLLRSLFPHGNELWWAWILVGIGCLLAIESVYREFNMRNRWSTYVRFAEGAFITEIGAGFLIGFGELKMLYMSTLIYAILIAVLFKRRFVKA